MGWEDDVRIASTGQPERQQALPPSEGQARQSQSTDLVKLGGTIRNLKPTRGYASFVLTESDRNKFGMLAVASALAGLDGAAASSLTYASDMEEAADFLEFEVNGKSVKGWVWRTPFKEGDAVEVVAGKLATHWEAFAIARPGDRTIALYPHCSRGTWSHCKNAFKWWVVAGGGTIVFGYVPLTYFIAGSRIFGDEPFWYVSGGLLAFFALMTISLARKWLPFSRVADKVFRALNLYDPVNIDLKKRSKGRRKPDDPQGYGVFYFRY